MVTAQLAIVALLVAAGPTPRGPVDFSHQHHLGLGLECTACHDAASGPGVPQLKLENGCIECHDNGAPEHRPLPKIRKLDVVFPHREHAEKFACTTCHSSIPDDKITEGEPVLTNARCFSCHEEKKVGVSTTACARCHGENRKVLRPASHGPDWRSTHGAQAAWNVSDGAHGQDCRQCHSKSSCTECHDQLAPRDHTGLWRQQAHGIAAQWDRDRCKTCHETSTCVRCHQTTEPANHAGPWLHIHGLAAGARVSESCSACHQPNWCAACHNTLLRP